MNGLDLFSGIGGISLALKPWVRTIAYCEQDRYAQGVLMSRMRDGSIDRAPIWDDVRTLQPEHFSVTTDIVFGGFPCQDISVAGRGAGLGGERSGLFFEIIRLVTQLRPRFVFLENVPAILVRGLDRVLMEFSSIGYDCRWTIVSAEELGAPHVRKRWFLMAYANSGRQLSEQDSGNIPPRWIGDSSTSMENPKRLRLEEPRGTGTKAADSATDSSWWIAEPAVGRVVNGLPMRVDRIRCLGNSVVPLAAREAFERLCGLK